MQLHRELLLPVPEFRKSPSLWEYCGGEGCVKMALVQVFLQVLQFLTLIIIPAVLYTDIFHLPDTDSY